MDREEIKEYIKAKQNNLLRQKLLDSLENDLKYKIRNTNPQELVKTIETETNALFRELPNKASKNE